MLPVMGDALLTACAEHGGVGMRSVHKSVAAQQTEAADMPALAALITRALAGDALAAEVRAFRRRFTGLHFMHA